MYEPVRTNVKPAEKVVAGLLVLGNLVAVLFVVKAVVLALGLVMNAGASCLMTRG